MASLYLIPTVLSDSPLDNVLPSNNANIIRSVKVFIVENIRTARRFLKQVDKSINIDELTFYPLNKHTSPEAISGYLKPLLEGLPMGVISEAGCPAVAGCGSNRSKKEPESDSFGRSFVHYSIGDGIRI